MGLVSTPLPPFYVKKAIKRWSVSNKRLKEEFNVRYIMGLSHTIEQDQVH